MTRGISFFIATDCVEICLARNRIVGSIGAMPKKVELTDEAAVEHLQNSGWLERHDAEITRNIGMQEFVNAVMANGDKSVMISINPWRWED